jgi:signal transduction histidine kinase
LIVAAALLLLLGVLATLQYRWLGEVSTAERDRLRNSLRARAADFTRDFDREITRTFLAFRPETDSLDADPAGVLTEALRVAQSESSVGGIVESVYLVDVHAAQGGSQLRQLDPVSRTLTAVEWPKEFEAWRRAAYRVVDVAPGLPSLFMGDAIDARIPALLVSLPSVRRISSGGRVAIVHDTEGSPRTLILRLDAGKVRRQLIETLLARHFGAGDASEYWFSVVSRDDESRPVYTSDRNVDVNSKNADVAAGLFDLRMDQLTEFARGMPPPPEGTPSGLKDRVAITIVRRGNGADASRVLMAGGDAQGAWQVLIRCKSGSLEALVASSRRRNLAIGLGVLGLLGASFIFVIGSARRQQRLAEQQMEFVAAVSHELRTPLAVIRSAGENLADGVVAESDQVRRYGSLIRTEGRRLSDMVERVMEFAGISSGAPVRTRSGIDVLRVVEEAVRTVQGDAQERGVSIAVNARGGLPPVIGDEAALRSAFQNVIGNAVKYSPDGASVGVDVGVDGDRLVVAVSDRGLGIDPADLPHVFKPFYRGRRAVDAQIRGTGVGLSVVRHVVEAHHGEVRIDSRAGDGTMVVVTLPAEARHEAHVADGAEARAST